MPEQVNLVYFDRARMALEKAASIDEVREIRDRAQALRLYVKQQGESLEMQNYCAEIKIRAERRAGDILSDMNKHPPGPPSGNRSHDGTDPPRLVDMGISRNQSSRWQSIASVPEEVFEREIAQKKDRGEELTSAAMLRTAKTLAKKESHNEMVRLATENACAVSDLLTLIASGQRFRTIYADPPWQYGNQVTRAATDNHYLTMNVEQIAELPINRLLENEAHLHLWTTNAFLFEAKTVLEAWGFEYKGVFVWVKPQMGIGNYWRVSHEFMILGVRGGLTFADRAQKSWMEADRTQHSSKPEIIRSVIEKVSPPPYLELFGRRTTPGWTVWGNEIDRTLFNEHCFDE